MAVFSQTISYTLIGCLLYTSLIYPTRIDPWTLVHPKRFDIIAKYIYAQNWYKQTHSDWPQRLYKEHIRAFNGFYEADPPKQSFLDFLDAFHTLLTSFKNGYDPTAAKVPIHPKHPTLIMNGAHRVATCLLYNLPIPTTFVPSKTPADFYDYAFFLNRGLSRSYADEMARICTQLPPKSLVAWIRIESHIHLRRLAQLFRPATIYYARPCLINETLATTISKNIDHQKKLYKGNGHGLVIAFPDQWTKEQITTHMQKINTQYLLFWAIDQHKKRQLANILFHQPTHTRWSNYTQADQTASLLVPFRTFLRRLGIPQEDVALLSYPAMQAKKIDFLLHHTHHHKITARHIMSEYDDIIANPAQFYFQTDWKIISPTVALHIPRDDILTYVETT